MLVLQRKAGEQVRIGNDVVVTVLKTASGKVSLGIQAPAYYRITRPEQRGAECELAAAASPDATVSAA